MRLDLDGLGEAHRACTSGQEGSTPEKLNEWLRSRSIDPDALFVQAEGGGLVWALQHGGNPDHYTTAIVAGFEWGYRAREMQDLFPQEGSSDDR